MTRRGVARRKGERGLLPGDGWRDAALDAHREAHALCWEASKGQIAANAYQAARTAARAGKVRAARHWFRIALRRDGSLLAMAENAPDVGPLLGDAEGLPRGRRGSRRLLSN